MTGRRPKPRIWGGVLMVISMLMIGSAVLRIGLQAGPALARSIPPEESTETTGTHHEERSHPAPEELQALLNAFQKRDTALKSREREIEDRMKALEIAERALDRRLAALQGAEAQLSATLSLADGASEDDLATLTSVYEKMKPKQSAALFETMDPEFAAGFLARMRPEAAAGIMAGLSPVAAYSISVVLAGRNARVPTE